MTLSAVIVAGGSGTRMQAQVPKQFLPLGNMPILFRTVKRFLRYRPDLAAVVVLPAANRQDWDGLTSLYLTPEELARVQVVDGGATRTRSVEAGLLALARISAPADTWVAIHDGVRPLFLTDMLDRAFAAAQEFGASVSCVPVKSSMRESVGQGESHPVDRDRFWHVQTPQTFRLDLILAAFARRTHDDFTDDASLYQAYQGPVAICEGSYDNLKVTTPEDLYVADALLRQQLSQGQPF